MSTTYYLLRTKTSAQGDGAYLGANADAASPLVPTAATACRFASLAEAEQAAAHLGPQHGGFELEVRNSVD